MDVFEPTERQKDAVRLLKSKRNILLYGGARSGKSVILVYTLLVRAILYAGSRHLIARLRFSHAKTSIWYETLIPLLEKYIDKSLWKSNKSDWFIKFANKSEIWLGGFDDRERTEKLLGHEYATIYFNEVSQIGYEAVEMGLPRLAQNIEGCKNKAYFDCNPPSPLHWSHKLFIENVDPRSGNQLENTGDYGSMLMNPTDNKSNLPADYIESVLMHLSTRMKRRMLNGEWVKAEGVVYDVFGESMIIKESDIPKLEERFVGVDFGLNIAGVYVGISGDNIYILDDYGAYNMTTSEFNSQINRRWKYNRAYCDPAGGERIQEITNGTKANNSVDPGLDYIQAKMTNGHFFVCDKCKGVLGEIWDYRRDEKERIIKENDHYLDAMRYACYSRATIPRPRARLL